MAKAKAVNEPRYSFNMVEFSKVSSMETACNLMFVICWYLPPPRVDKSESHHVTTQLRYGYSGTGSATIYCLQVPPTLIQDLQFSNLLYSWPALTQHHESVYLEEALQIEQRSRHPQCHTEVHYLNLQEKLYPVA